MSEPASSYFPPASPHLRPSSPQTTRRGTMSSRFPRTTSSTSISGQNRRPQPGRSASVASSNFNSRGGQLYDREGGLFSEAEEAERSESTDEDEDPGATPRRGRPMSIGRQSAHDAVAAGEDTTPEGNPIDREFNEDDPLTVKDRQSLINVQHPFGLPIWKPALYQKSRTVTRNAETELHSQPSRVIDSHYLPGNIIWTLVFGWWMALIFLVPAIILYLVPRGGRQYSRLSYGLAWYIFWPFGKYVQGDGTLDDEKEDGDDRSVATDLESGVRRDSGVISSAASETSTGTVRGPPPSQPVTAGLGPSPSWDPVVEPNPTISLLRNPDAAGLKSYGSVPADLGPAFDAIADAKRHWLGRACFWLFLLCCILPIMLIVCLICWAFVLTIPMAKLQWELINHLIWRHDKIQFCSAPQEIVVPSTSELATSGNNLLEGNGVPAPASFTVKAAPRLQPGQTAPTGSPKSKVLLCTYRAAGLQYYKYTVGGVNIMFINLLPVVFLVILDGFFLMPWVEKKEHHGEHVHPLLQFFASQALVFVLSLASVIPLSYFIGMAVASISAQSSIGMGAVINATFGSIIEIILYGIALTQGKGLLVEGSIVGSLLASVGLMPGVSMISGAMRQKEQKFNAKSAGVTSTMLIMAIIGTLTPTLFYQTYGNFELVCDGCPKSRHAPDDTWRCRRCVYRHPDPVTDQFYQTTVKPLMYFCAGILLFSYLIGMWFSLRTHASQIWQNPQQLMNPLEAGSHITSATGGRLSMYNKLAAQQTKKLLRKASILTTGTDMGSTLEHRSGSGDGAPPTPYLGPNAGGSNLAPPSPILRRVSYAPGGPSQSPSRALGSSSTPMGVVPILETVSTAVKDPTHPTLPLPSNLTTEDFTRAVAVTVSALRQHEGPATASHVGPDGAEHGGGGHDGHEAPSWSRTTSATVLLSCTVLYAAIAEILVDVVDVVLQGSGIDEKFLGITLFALVPNTTEFMNAISFAMNGNIALSMEIGSAYALQVCLLQIPAMVAFSAWYDPRDFGQMASTFTMVFPKWDVIAIIFSIFLLTYTYIEAKSNYHRGSILVLSYLVLTSGFYFAPSRLDTETLLSTTAIAPARTFLQSVQTSFLSLFTH
ncbi:hypothetical protein FS837_003954 [Tulasnella sp. UAMH 9824]|nr:hypothetical protein FS837_003954 [Tulasnella sp. UAMH 9824]